MATASFVTLIAPPSRQLTFPGLTTTMGAFAIARASLRASSTLRARAISGRSGPIRAFSIAPILREKRYAESHEWIEYSQDEKTVTVGISEYAAKNLGDVVFVELPAVGTEIGAEDSFGAVESVKSASDLYSPVSGKVVETNEELEKTPGKINKDPEGTAWIAKLEVTGKEAEALMDAEAYKAFTEAEE